MDFATARRMMVDGQVRTADVTDPRLIDAMLDIPREHFVPHDKASFAYVDLDPPVTRTRRLLRPMVLAKLIQTAAITEADRILDVGCATGYSTAVMARLARFVNGLEEDAELAQKAAATLSGAGIGNADVVTAPLTKGFPQGAPYDVILIEGSIEVVPETLFDQLAEGGRLVCVMGRGQAAKATLYRRIEGEVSGRSVFDAAAAPLPGFDKPPEFVF